MGQQQEVFSRLGTSREAHRLRTRLQTGSLQACAILFWCVGGVPVGVASRTIFPHPTDRQLHLPPVPFVRRSANGIGGEI